MTCACRHDLTPGDSRDADLESGYALVRSCCRIRGTRVYRPTRTTVV